MVFLLEDTIFILTPFGHKLNYPWEKFFSVIRTGNRYWTMVWVIVRSRTTVNHVMIESFSLQWLKQVQVELVTPRLQAYILQLTSHFLISHFPLLCLLHHCIIVVCFFNSRGKPRCKSHVHPTLAVWPCAIYCMPLSLSFSIFMLGWWL
jgi:hypothetical protein